MSISKMAGALSLDQVRSARRYALQYLYGMEMTSRTTFHFQDFQVFCEQMEVPSSVQLFMKELVSSVMENLSWIDECIAKHSNNWSLSRMGKVDLSVLRLVIEEMRMRPELSFKILIQEGVNMGGEYGTNFSPSFVNGVLDAVARSFQKK